MPCHKARLAKHWKTVKAKHANQTAQHGALDDIWNWITGGKKKADPPKVLTRSDFIPMGNKKIISGPHDGDPSYKKTMYNSYEEMQNATAKHSEYDKERKEHPSLPDATVQQIVEDHSAKHSGLGQIPTDYKKQLQGGLKRYQSKVARHWKAAKTKHASTGSIQTLSHGTMPPHRIAHHQDSGIGMKEYALLDVAFLREGEWRTSGKAYHYSWDIIEKGAPTFKGQEFFLNHQGENMVGTEMGIIDDVYFSERNGTPWLCAKVKVPESEFTQAFLDRVKNGLIKAVSSTHNFQVDVKNNPSEVINITGKAISAVRKGEIPGAEIISVQRNIRGG